MYKKNCLNLTKLELDEKINNKISDLNNLLEFIKDNKSNITEEVEEKTLISMLKNIQELEPLVAVRLLKVNSK